MKKLLIHLLIYSTIPVVFSAYGMTPKYPYEPVTTTCLTEVALAGEAVIKEANKTPVLRLQADLTIAESPDIPDCPSVLNIKVVLLEFNTKEVLTDFNELVGRNILVLGSVESGDAIDTKQVTFTVTTISEIE